jgi:4'-phosphopantetheinyl transferase
METIQQPATSNQHRVIYPVILSVPEKDRQLSGREKVARLSRHARQALEISARKIGVVLPELLKDENGAPLPFKGTHWSLTHKIQYVGAVVASARIGIDIEQIRPCSKALFKKTANQTEWSLADNHSSTLFFRFWTSKECVLKAVGTGIKDLSKCRVVEIINDDNLLIDYQDKQWHIEHSFFDGHIVSVVKNEFEIQWTIIT